MTEEDKGGLFSLFILFSLFSIFMSLPSKVEDNEFFVFFPDYYCFYAETNNETEKGVCGLRFSERIAVERVTYVGIYYIKIETVGWNKITFNKSNRIITRFSNSKIEYFAYAVFAIVCIVILLLMLFRRKK
ncbi:hypothetical protein [Leptospira sp. B5-022]|uniref:hypothetical protein n=1 Tax=Leptospira sp. B5-022 TaxID=1242992 RepID=UPI00055DFDB9|nr:hypothetical protein [Leptospira sp. B5-022]